MDAGLHTVHARATSRRELGRVVGEQVRQRVHAAWERDEALHKLVAWSGTDDGRAIVDAFVKANQTAYPAHAEECAGLAEGLGQLEDHVWIANMRQELVSFLPKEEGVGPAVGCTDYHILSVAEDGTLASVWSHNEDGTAAGERSAGYVVRAELLEPDKPPLYFVGYAYPGCLVGWAWAYNLHGIVSTINALTFCAPVVGLAATLVGRDVLEARSLDDAIQRAAVPGQGGAQHLNLGSVREPARHVSIETSPHGASVAEMSMPGEGSRAPVCKAFANSYQRAAADGTPAERLEGRSGVFLESCEVRLARAAELTPQLATRISESAANAAKNALACREVALVIAGDREGRLPIFRDGAPPDYGATDHGVLVDLVAARLSVYNGRLRAEDLSPVSQNMDSWLEEDIPHESGAE